jgi:hypothetical protein
MSQNENALNHPNSTITTKQGYGIGWNDGTPKTVED